MIKNFLIAAVLVIASPALVFSQDFFWSFDSDSLLNTDTQDSGSSSAYIFSDGEYAFDAIDLDFFTSDSSVVRFTGGEAFNPTFDTLGGMRFTSSEIAIDTTTNTGNLFSVNIIDNGVHPAVGPLFDPGFNPEVGPNGGVLLARLDFDIGGSGTTDFGLSLGDVGGIQLPDILLDPSFGSASLTNSGLGPSVEFPPLPVETPVVPPVDPPVVPPVDPPVGPPLGPPSSGGGGGVLVPTSADLFVAFSEDSQPVGTSGTAFIFADGSFGFDALDLDFRSSDSSVLLLTGGEANNDPFDVIGGSAFDSSDVTIAADGASGNLFAVNITQNGISRAISELFNPHFDPAVGPNGAVLLAEIDYDLVGSGTASIELSLGSQGVLQLPDTVIDPAVGSGSLTAVAAAVIPEPSSAVLLILAAAGVIAQRRKSLR